MRCKVDDLAKNNENNQKKKKKGVYTGLKDKTESSAMIQNIKNQKDTKSILQKMPM